jgi:hypothetical protein
MDHIGGVFIVGVEEENHLQPSSAVATTDYSPFVFLSQFRVGSVGMFHYMFRLFWRDTMLGNVLQIPIIPSK